MSRPRQRPWTSGPGEILQHGISLLRSDSDANRRLAMLSIDNAVELTIKTYLGLPTRVTGVSLSRNNLQELTQSFPRMIQALETHASSKLDGVDLGEIEWFHNLRNELYHQGNGLTVDREKVEVYAELAKLLFANLFDTSLEVGTTEGTEKLGTFMANWARIERATTLLSHGKAKTTNDFNRFLYDNPYFDEATVSNLRNLRQVRNRVVHGSLDYKEALTTEVLQNLDEVTERVEALATENPQQQNPLREITLTGLSIPSEVIDGLLAPGRNASNWDALLLLLHYAKTGLSNKQIRSLSSEIGKPISFSWLDTEFHRKTNAELVVARPITDSKEKNYFLSELGKRRALDLIEGFTNRNRELTKSQD